MDKRSKHGINNGPFYRVDQGLGTWTMDLDGIAKVMDHGPGN